jgi:hypothetical protein
VTHFRVADCKASLPALEKYMALCQGGDSLDWFFPAMVHWKFGHKEQASKWYNQAVRWMNQGDPAPRIPQAARADAHHRIGESARP